MKARVKSKKFYKSEDISDIMLTTMEYIQLFDKAYYYTQLRNYFNFSKEQIKQLENIMNRDADSFMTVINEYPAADEFKCDEELSKNPYVKLDNYLDKEFGIWYDEEDIISEKLDKNEED